MRLFLAVDFPEGEKYIFYQTAMELKHISSQGTFTRKENLHLTLSFLGEVYPDRLAGLKRVMEEAGRGFGKSRPAPIMLVPSHIGAFRGRDGDIYYVGFQHNPSLNLLYDELSKRLLKSGFLKEEGSFKAHLTLGRRIRLKSGVSAAFLMDALTGLSIPVSEFCLMQSERIHGLLTYTDLHRTKLISL